MVGPEEIALAVRTLRAGGVVAFPTETVYGLGADALNEAAVRRVYELKGRPSNNPLIVHTADAQAARAVTSHWPAHAEALARRFWPGPLTLVLPKAAAIPPIVTAGSPNVAVRCPDHPTTLALLHAFAGPLVGPSANPSGRVSPTTAAHVRAGFPNVPVLDGGPCRAGIESTVVSLVGSPTILRPGVISTDDVERVLGERLARPPTTPATGAMPGPGMLASHYAPVTPLRLVDIHDLSQALAAAPRAVVLAPPGTPVPPPHTLLVMPTDAGPYAARLYAALREADAMRPSLIVVVTPPGDGDPLWHAITDRLSRAAT